MFQTESTMGNGNITHESGRISSKGIYSNDLEEGLWIAYWDNGEKKSTSNHKNGKLHGKLIRFDRFGTIQYSTKFTNGTGLQKRFHDNGQLQSEGNLNGMDMDGTWEYYFDTGQLQSKGDWSNDEKEGTWTYYHENGKISSIITYEEGKANGPLKVFFENGKLSRSGNLVDDVENGVMEVV